MMGMIRLDSSESASVGAPSVRVAGYLSSAESRENHRLSKSMLTNDREATKEVQSIALDTNFAIPGDPGFPLNQVRSLHII